MLHYNTVSPQLRAILQKLMAAPEFAPFRLVGGTALSLHRGHRMSIDIDLFTDAGYGSIDFDAIEKYLRSNFDYVDTTAIGVIGMGKSYFIGDSSYDSIKLDLYYTDAFIEGPVIEDGIRLASVNEIIAMKLDVILRTGRRKDFYDIRELSDEYPIASMLELHEKRYPFTHDRKLLLKQFSNFEEADDDFEPDCLRGRHWELIKLDITEFAGNL